MKGYQGRLCPHLNYVLSTWHEQASANFRAFDIGQKFYC